jgi:hypothetical protein
VLSKILRSTLKTSAPSINTELTNIHVIMLKANEGDLDQAELFPRRPTAIELPKTIERRATVDHHGPISVLT